MLLFNEDKLKAVAYYRHSAEDKQENSVAIQREQVERFAEREQIQILEHFKDEGISGLTANRPGFQQMFADWVTNHSAEHIDYILVYDASRFGRFQEMSEVWHWLGLCNRRDIKLASVTRGLPRNETSVIDSFIITLDFSMSGEFSKILSEKVAYGSIKVAEQGYSPGGCAPYGYKRVLLSEQRERIGTLERGEHKLISNQRVSLEPDTAGKAKVVKRIFKEFVDYRYFPVDIADGLNDDGILTTTGRQWNASGIVRILSNETYTGTRLYNKTWKRLKAKQIKHNPQHEWVRSLNAHEAIVGYDMFQKAQERLYWLQPRRRNYNALQVNNVSSYVWRYINKQLDGATSDQQFYIKRSLPITFGMVYGTADDRKVCFYTPTKMKHYDQVIGCAIDPSESDSLVGLYNIPTDLIGHQQYHITEIKNHQTSFDVTELDENITRISKDIIKSDAPWLFREQLNTPLTY